MMLQRREEELRTKREAMVTQIAQRGVSDPRVLNALRAVPRHRFVSAQSVPEAYGDFPLPINAGQTISQPLMVGLMTQLLRLTGSECVLEIGTGSGYQTAVLALLCREVVTVERHAALSHEAQTRLEALGIRHTVYTVGDGTEGCAAMAPYEAIIVTAGAPPAIPPPLMAQLARGGRLVIPLGNHDTQALTLIFKAPDGTLERQTHGSCLFVPLIGRYGWRGDSVDG